MADGVTLEQVLEEQKAMTLLAGEMTKTTDPEQLAQLTAMLQEMAANLQSMLDALAQSIKDAYPGAFDANGEPIVGPVPRIEVMLTPPQRALIESETGVDMASVLIDDPNGIYLRMMREMAPEAIQEIALEKARAFIELSKALEEAERQRAELEAALPDDVKALLAEQKQG